MKPRRQSRRTCPAAVPGAARILVVIWVIAAALLSALFLLHGAWPVAVAEMMMVCGLWAALAATRR
ncbi:MAG TPA: hypothetical protein VF637_14345 [Sphingomicrobium sp.]